MSSEVSNYRPSTSRSVNIIGEFSEELAANAIPIILKLREESNDPITVYIHSRGGFVSVLEAIDAALRTRGFDDDEVRVLTVAVGDVSSSAANLLALGTYALAYPSSTILFHGIRVGEIQVTFESAQNVAGYLSRENRKMARRISQAILPRVMFRFFQLRQTFQKKGSAPLKPVDSLKGFSETLAKRTGSTANRILHRTCKRVCEASDLTAKIFSKIDLGKSRSPKGADAKVLRAVLKHEISNAKGKDWRLDEPGMTRLVEDYFLLREFSMAQSNEQFFDTVQLYGPEFISVKENEEYQALKKQEDKRQAPIFLFTKASSHIALLWFFTVTLSHNLFVGENELSARDAYFLGLVDEIIGMKWKCERSVMEEKEKPPKAGSSTA